MIKVFLLSLIFLAPLGSVQGDTRGIRNNNPANLVKSNIPWNGKVKECSDSRFECFSSPYYGLRAMYKTIYSYYYKHNKKSIREIIHRWSPPNENDTNLLIRRVARATNWDGNRTIPVDDIHFIYALGRALIINENSVDPYTYKLHRRAIENAFRNNNNVRKYYAGRGSKALVNEHEGQGRTTEGINRKDNSKEQGSSRGKGGEEQTLRIHKKVDSFIDSLRSDRLSFGSSPLLWTGGNSWLDRVAERILILHRREGCLRMEDCYRVGNYTPPYAPSSRNQWAILRRFYDGKSLS